jgi:hypothetical protein
MDMATHRKLLAEIYEVRENALLAQFDRMMPQIRNDAIVTLSIERKLDKRSDSVPNFA